MRTFLRCVAVVAVAGMTFVGQINAEDKNKKEEEKKVAIDKLPQAVTDAVKKMFPKSELVEATEEKEDDEVEYEVTIKLDGKKIDVTVEANGKIEEFEKEIDLKDLPQAVVDAVEMKYPKSVHKSAEAVYEIEDGKEELEFYEVKVETADKKQVEVMIKANGKIVTKKNEDKEDEKDDDKEDKKEDK
jgi:hypothetical protein